MDEFKTDEGKERKKEWQKNKKKQNEEEECMYRYMNGIK